MVVHIQFITRAKISYKHILSITSFQDDLLPNPWEQYEAKQGWRKVITKQLKISRELEKVCSLRLADWKESIPEIALYCCHLHCAFRLPPPWALFTILPQQCDKHCDSPCYLHKWQQNRAALWRSHHTYNKIVAMYIIRRASIFVSETAKVWEKKGQLMPSVQLLSIHCWPTDFMLVCAHILETQELFYSSTSNHRKNLQLWKCSWWCETTAVQDPRTGSQTRDLESFYLDKPGRTLG